MTRPEWGVTVEADPGPLIKVSRALLAHDVAFMVLERQLGCRSFLLSHAHIRAAEKPIARDVEAHPEHYGHPMVEHVQ